MTAVHVRAWQGQACPTCGSRPLLGAPTDRHAWFCPQCCGYFTTDLVPVPRRGSESAVTHGTAKARNLGQAQDPAHRAEVGSLANPPGTDDVRPQLGGPVSVPEDREQLGLRL